MTYDLIIIGGGPSGITAGIYAARHKLNTLLITKEFGGQMAKGTVAIENYPGFEKISGIELIQKFEAQLRKHKIDIRMDVVAGVEKKGDIFFITVKDKSIFEARAVIVTSGADPRPLEAEGEKEFIGKGVSYCVTCDGPVFANKIVAVIGGGNSAFEAALFLSKIASKIYILESGSQVRADETNQKMVQVAGNIEVITSVDVKKIQGDKFVNSIIYQQKLTGENKTLELQGVFVEIGHMPATSFVKDLVEFNEKDEIKIDLQTCQTKTPGLFSSGDVTEVKIKQIVVAAGEGTKAAVAAYRYLDDKH
ncbi:MAG: FAD-dependent oxidoreductase [bacterium]|nr:FAD-dependent oxidoreductase [bacterium]